MSIAISPLIEEVLSHRLSVPDAIDDALTDCDDPKHTSEQISDAIDAIEGMIAAGYIPDWAKDDPCICDVLEDCLDGSTFFATMHAAVRDNECSQQRYNSSLRVAEKFASDLSKLIGRNVRVADM